MDKSTDVLSFPMGENGEYDTNLDTGAKVLGDIIISIEHAYAQAEKYGQRFLRKGEAAVMNVYELDNENLQEFSHIVFEAYDSKWLDYVTACRKGQDRAIYDIIEGGIADDQVFDTIDLYFSGIYTYEQALDQLRFKHPNHQVCITNQLVLDKYLRFIESIKL